MDFYNPHWGWGMYDIAKTGHSIGGRDCITFFSRSKLPVDIWETCGIYPTQIPKQIISIVRSFPSPFVSFSCFRMAIRTVVMLVHTGRHRAWIVPSWAFFEDVTGVTIADFAIISSATFFTDMPYQSSSIRSSAYKHAQVCNNWGIPMIVDSQKITATTGQSPPWMIFFVMLRANDNSSDPSPLIDRLFQAFWKQCLPS